MKTEKLECSHNNCVSKMNCIIDGNSYCKKHKEIKYKEDNQTFKITLVVVLVVVSVFLLIIG